MASIPLASLLRLCYGEAAADVSLGPSEFLDVLLAADQLAMTDAIKTLNTAWEVQVAAQDPLGAYFVAVRKQLNSCSSTAAKLVLQKGLDHQYVPEMETIPSLPYIRLVRYCEECRAAAKKALHDACVDADPPPLSAPSAAALQGTDALNGGPSVDPGQDGWLQRYIDTLSNLGGTSGSTENVFQQASVNQQWCSPCDLLARKLTRLSEALRSMPNTVGRVRSSSVAEVTPCLTSFCLADYPRALSYDHSSLADE